MALDFHVNLTDGNLHNPKGFSLATAATRMWKSEKSQISWEEVLLLPSALDFTNNTLAPPTEVAGDVYLLTNTGASHADWDGASGNSWVRYDLASDLWVEILAVEGFLVWDKTGNNHLSFNGTSWTAIGGAGDVANDVIWDAIGDLVVGTGANTAAKLIIGSTNDVLTVSGGTAVWSPITTVGTISTGVWQGTAIGDAYIIKTGDWTGTFDGQEGTYYLNRANHTGSQLLSTISDVTATAAEVNLLDLAGLTIGWVLSADSATTASWKAPTGGASNTIYSADDSLAGNRIVTQGANTLSFTASAVNAFSIDGTTFSVDASNNRVGIGTAAPTANLHVVGTSIFTDDANFDSNTLFIDASTSRIGIGTAAPTTRLHFAGTVTENALINVTGVVGSGSGIAKGLTCTVTAASGQSDLYCFEGDAVGANATDNYAARFTANGASSNNYGSYNFVSGAAGANFAVFGQNQSSTTSTIQYGGRFNNRATAINTTQYGVGGYADEGNTGQSRYGVYGEGSGNGNTGGRNYGARFAAFGTGNDGNHAIVATQGNIGFGTATPSASAILDVTSTTQGFLPPRMTGPEATTFEGTTPPDGSMIYVSSTDGTFSAVGIWVKVAGTFTQL